MPCHLDCTNRYFGPRCSCLGLLCGSPRQTSRVPSSSSSPAPSGELGVPNSPPPPSSLNANPTNSLTGDTSDARGPRSVSSPTNYTEYSVDPVSPPHNEHARCPTCRGRFREEYSEVLERWLRVFRTPEFRRYVLRQRKAGRLQFDPDHLALQSNSQFEDHVDAAYRLTPYAYPPIHPLVQGRTLSRRGLGNYRKWSRYVGPGAREIPRPKGGDWTMNRVLWWHKNNPQTTLSLLDWDVSVINKYIHDPGNAAWARFRRMFEEV